MQMKFEQSLKLKGQATLVLIIQCCLVVVLACVGLIYQPDQGQFESLIYPTCCFLLLLSVWSYYSWYAVTGSLFNPYLLFFLSAVIFNGGQAFLEIFHLNHDGFLRGDFSSEALFKALFLVTVSLACFHLGGLISATQDFAKPEISLKPIFLSVRSETTHKIGLGLLSISLFPAILMMKSSLSVASSAGYEALYQQDEATGLGAASMILAEFLIPASLFLLSGSQKKPRSRFIASSIIIAYALSRFIVGQRNSAIMPLIAFSWLWNYLIHPLPKLLLLSSSSILVFIIFPLISITRNIAGEDRLSLNVILDNFATIENPAVSIISEMGYSMMTVAHTIDLVPRIRDFSWGAEYFYALLTLMPNLFWEIHPTVARGKPGPWLVEIVNPEFAARGGSYGYSFIAEAYLNFGWIGAPIFLGIIGFLFAKFTLWAMRSKDPAKLAAIASFLSVFLFFARAESALQVRPLIWYSLLPYFCVHLLSKRLLKKLFHRSTA